jgi:hypothetical protein
MQTQVILSKTLSTGLVQRKQVKVQRPAENIILNREFEIEDGQ